MKHRLSFFVMMVIAILLFPEQSLASPAQEPLRQADVSAFLAYRVINEEADEAELYYCNKILYGEYGQQAFPATSTLELPTTVMIGDKEYTVTVIADNVFSGLGDFEDSDGRYDSFYIKKIILPTKLRKLGSRALNVNSSSLTVVMPETLEEIGNHCMPEELNEATYVIPKNVTTIGEGALGGSMLNITFLNNNFEIKKSIFAGCSWAYLKVLGENLSVAASTFSGTTLYSLELGEYPITIGRAAFNNSWVDESEALSRVIVRCREAYDIPADAFSDYVFNNATLVVSESAAENFSNAIGWKKFQHVETFPDAVEFPIVDESRLWRNYMRSDESAMRLSTYYIRFHGKETINGINYARCYRYPANVDFNPETMTPAAYVREQGYRTYVLPNPGYGIDFTGLPVGGALASDSEILLYDFSSTEAMGDLYGVDVTASGIIATLDGRNCATLQCDNALFIQGIGFVSAEDGDLLSPMARAGEYGCAGLMDLSKGQLDMTDFRAHYGYGYTAYVNKHKPLDITCGNMEWVYYVNYNPDEDIPYEGFYNARVEDGKCFRYQGAFVNDNNYCANIFVDANDFNVYGYNSSYRLHDFDRFDITLPSSHTLLYDYSTLEREWAVGEVLTDNVYRRTFTRDFGTDGKVVIIEGLGVDCYGKYVGDIASSYILGGEKLQGGLCLVRDIDTGEVIYRGNFYDKYTEALNAQTTAHLTGVVTNSAKVNSTSRRNAKADNAIEGATVIFSRAGDNYQGVTDAEGVFSIEVPIGKDYAMTVAKEGFSTYNKTGIDINADPTSHTIMIDIAIDEISGVSDVNTDNSFYAMGGDLVIDVDHATAVLVVDAMGRVVRRLNAQPGRTIITGLSRGIYIVNGCKIAL